MVQFDKNEEIILKINPSLKPALAKTSIGILITLSSTYYYFSQKTNMGFETSVLIYTFYFFGILIFFLGLSDTIRNLRTTYYITSSRVLKEYKSPLKLEINEIPVSKIRGIETKKDYWENIFGLGHIVVASGSGRHFNIQLKNIDNAEKLAEKVRGLL